MAIFSVQVSLRKLASQHCFMIMQERRLQGNMLEFLSFFKNFCCFVLGISVFAFDIWQFMWQIELIVMLQISCSACLHNHCIHTTCLRISVAGHSFTLPSTWLASTGHGAPFVRAASGRLPRLFTCTGVDRWQKQYCGDFGCHYITVLDFEGPRNCFFDFTNFPI